MAHKSITTTQRYIKVVDANKREASKKIILFFDAPTGGFGSTISHHLEQRPYFGRRKFQITTVYDK